METTINISIEAIAEHLASMWNLRKNDFISVDELRAIRFSIEALVGEKAYNEAKALSMTLINNR